VFNFFMQNRAVILSSFGRDPLTFSEWPVPELEDGMVSVQMIAAPVNPADLNIIEGKYGELPGLPAIPGSEGVGRVVAVGAGVKEISAGDLVAVIRRGTWSEHLTVGANDVFVLPDSIDPLQAAMLGVNPPTALLMLESLPDLKPGEWVVQNAANSGVGRSVIQIAKARGLRTLNIVRREELVAELTQLGADCVVTEETDLRTAAKDLCGGCLPRLGLNAVGGASALNLANGLAKGGHLITYGAMGRQPLKIPNGLLIFKNLTFSGFWLTRWKSQSSREEQNRVFSELGKMLADQKLHIAIHRTFPASQINEALAEAATEKRQGKVLLDFSELGATKEQ
jgi:NADPH:quinone reductase-like Zn-dependent oxidoreductase